MQIEEGRRYPNLEQHFVRQSCARAGMITNGKSSAIEKIVRHVSDRLDKGSDEYGATRFWHRPAVGDPNDSGQSLIAELLEEVADIYGWGALLHIRLRHEGFDDLATELEIATANQVFYGDKLKMIEAKLAQRLAGR